MLPRIGFGKKRRTILGYSPASLAGLRNATSVGGYGALGGGHTSAMLTVLFDPAPGATVAFQ
jgi:hypothetical protein